MREALRGARAVVVVLAGLLSMPSGCRDQHDGPASTLRVLAAASMTEAMQTIAADFERTNPGTKVQLSFAGSQVLKVQITQGAPADVFLSANEAHVHALVAAGLARDPVPVATNTLALIVPRASPSVIGGLADLPRARRLVIGHREVPVGAYAHRLLKAADARFGPDFSARSLKNVVSEESNVRLVRAKVAMGEADAAIVYRSDALRSPGVVKVPIPPELNVRATYLATVCEASSEPALAHRFVAHVRGEAGQASLQKLGFGGAP